MPNLLFFCAPECSVAGNWRVLHADERVLSSRDPRVERYLNVQRTDHRVPATVRILPDELLECLVVESVVYHLENFVPLSNRRLTIGPEKIVVSGAIPIDFRQELAGFRAIAGVIRYGLRQNQKGREHQRCHE